jgi:hypothetical protein
VIEDIAKNISGASDSMKKIEKLFHMLTPLIDRGGG